MAQRKKKTTAKARKRKPTTKKVVSRKRTAKKITTRAKKPAVKRRIKRTAPFLKKYKPTNAMGRGLKAAMITIAKDPYKHELAPHLHGLSEFKKEVPKIKKQQKDYAKTKTTKTQLKKEKQRAKNRIKVLGRTQKRYARLESLKDFVDKYKVRARKKKLPPGVMRKYKAARKELKNIWGVNFTDKKNEALMEIKAQEQKIQHVANMIDAHDKNKVKFITPENVHYVPVTKFDKMGEVDIADYIRELFITDLENKIKTAKALQKKEGFSYGMIEGLERYLDGIYSEKYQVGYYGGGGTYYVQVM